MASGGFFELESGSSPIKVSAFTAATAPDGTELIPGVQGGVNVAFTTAQLLTGADAAGGSDNPGTGLMIKSGDGDGSGLGGDVNIISGSATGAYAGRINITGGVSGVYGGIIHITGGYSETSTGGDVYIAGGGTDSGDIGRVVLDGRSIEISNLKTSDPSVPDAIWSDNGVLVQSGVTNFSGTITTGSLVGKTITVVNGIITDFS